MINSTNLVLFEIVSILILFLSVLTEFSFLNKTSVGVDKPFIHNKLDIFSSNIKMILTNKQPEYLIFTYTFVFISIIIFFILYINLNKEYDNLYINLYLIISISVIFLHFIVQYKMYIEYAKLYLNKKNIFNINVNELIEFKNLLINRDKSEEMKNINTIDFNFNSYNSYINIINKLKQNVNNIEPLEYTDFKRLCCKFNDYFLYLKINNDIYEIEKDLKKTNVFYLSKIKIEYNKTIFSLWSNTNETLLKLSMYIEILMFFIILNILIYFKI